MKGKKSKLAAVLTHQCPVCRQSSIFENPQIYPTHDMGATHEHCPVCGTHLKPEPGFYYGAMYVAWALIVALWISVLVALKVFDAVGLIHFGFLTHPVTFLTTGLLTNVGAFPYLFRLSRSLWAHMFLKTGSERI